MTAKVVENRLRRIACRYGYRLVKSPRRDPYAPDFDRFALATIRTGEWANPKNSIVDTPFSMTADDVAKFLNPERN